MGFEGFSCDEEGQDNEPMLASSLPSSVVTGQLTFSAPYLRNFFQRAFASTEEGNPETMIVLIASGSFGDGRRVRGVGRGLLSRFSLSLG